MLTEVPPPSGHADRCLLTELTEDNSAVRLLLTGDIDALSARHLQQSLIDVLRRRSPGDIEVDVSGVTSLGPAGLEALLRCQTDAQQLECRLLLTNPSPLTYRVLQVAGQLERFGLARPRPAGSGSGPAGAALGLVNCGLGG
jgi:anti-anti-sigma factor